MRKGDDAPHITAPNNHPTPAVTAIATAPQNVTRAAPSHGDAPPVRAASTPSPARQNNDAPATKIDIRFSGATATVTIGRTAPAAKAAADAHAACKGRVAMFYEIPSSSRACAPSASCAIN